MQQQYREFLIRDWAPADRQPIANLISRVLAEYGLNWDPTNSDRDVLEVETCYQQADGAFWVVETAGRLVGSAGYYPITRGDRAVEIRKMYLLPEVRGLGLGRYLLQALEAAIAAQNFAEIWIETSSLLVEAVQLYESSGYQPASGVETPRCDRVYVKHI